MTNRAPPDLLVQRLPGNQREPPVNTEQTISRVVECIARTTRYPTQILVADADLENDLGIDSVKQAEVITALGQEFGIDLQSRRDPSVRTIGQVAAWIDAAGSAPTVAAAPADVAPATSAPAAANSIAFAPVAPTPSPLASASTAFIPVTPASAHPAAAFTPASAPAAPVAPAPVASAPASPVAAISPAPTVVALPTAQPPAFEAGLPGAPSPRPLTGRVALVTGSGRGIGRIVAEVLAQRGATVIINSFHSRDQGERTSADINAAGGQAVHVWGSVAKPEHVQAMFAEIDQRFGHLDILVCNASDGRIGAFSELSSADWDRAFRTNVSGHYDCAMHAARRMRPRGGGSIVTMSTVGAHQYLDGLGSQGVVKAAVEALTRYLACELAPQGVRANCVAAGPVYGDLLSKFTDARAAQHHWEAMTPGGALCSPTDIARTIAFLVSDDARAVNGAVWSVDRGFSAHADSRFQAHGLAPASLRTAQG